MKKYRTDTPLDVEANIADEGHIARFTDSTMSTTDFISIGFGKDPATNYQYGLLQYQWNDTNSSQDSYIGLGLKNNKNLEIEQMKFKNFRNNIIISFFGIVIVLLLVF